MEESQLPITEIQGQRLLASVNARDTQLNIGNSSKPTQEKSGEATIPHSSNMASTKLYPS